MGEDLLKIFDTLPKSRQKTAYTGLNAQAWTEAFSDFKLNDRFYYAQTLIFLNAIAEQKPLIYQLPTELGNYVLSEKAASFILPWEGYSKVPYVPASSDQSGVTIGYGYDLGQQTQSSAQQILSKYYTPEQVTRLLHTIGQQGGQARAFVTSLADITISKEKAFTFALELKNIYSSSVISIYPEAIDPPADAAGALLSLIYNRGTSLKVPLAGDTLDTRKEMRELQQDFATGELDMITTRLRSMERLWPDLKGLRRRREGEAELVENHLNALKSKTI